MRGREARRRPGCSFCGSARAETWSQAVVGTAAADHKARQPDPAGGILCDFARFLPVTLVTVPRHEFAVIEVARAPGPKRRAEAVWPTRMRAARPPAGRWLHHHPVPGPPR